MQRPLFKWTYWVHSWTGLIVGVFLTVLGITGSVLAFLPELEVRESPSLMAVTPTQGWTSPDRALLTIVRAYPSYRLFLLVLPMEPTMPYRVYLADSKGSIFRATLNPYTGAILGLFPDSKRVSAWVGDLHTTLFLGRWGYMVGAVFSLVLVVSIISGFYVHLKIVRPMFQQTRGRKGIDRKSVV